MRCLPWSLALLSYANLAFAMLIPMEIMVTQGFSITEPLLVFLAMTPEEGLLFSMGLINSYLLRVASEKTYWVTAVLSSVLLFDLASVENPNSDWVFGLSQYLGLTFVAAHLLIFLPSARRALKDPDQRWWKTPRRRLAAVDVFVGQWIGGCCRARTHDISVSGAFIRTPRPEIFKIGERLALSLRLGALFELRCTAKVARIERDSAAHLPGIGVVFVDMTRFQSRTLRRFI